MVKKIKNQANGWAEMAIWSVNNSQAKKKLFLLLRWLEKAI
jgi:hypothetical protein